MKIEHQTPANPRRSADSPPRLKAPTEIEDFLLYRLFCISQVALRGTDEMYKRELGISRREFRVLAYLARTPDASLKALASDAGIDVVVTSRCVAKMCDRGFISKQRSRSNKRVIGLCLTPVGEDLHQRAKVIGAAYNRKFAECLTDDEAYLVDGLLDKLARQAERVSRRG